MDGIINLNKPTGISSAKALYRVRRITRQRKSGHAGTLDPAASGVLILCLGRATRLVEAVMALPKVYRATARLDATSESLDSDSPLESVEVASPPERDQVLEACRALEGEILQVPPIISALKVGGRPAYKLARRGEEVKLEPRPVRVHWLHVHAYSYPEIDFEMCCGRGTYVRSIIRDLGKRLGAGGCLTSLVRSQVGPFTLNDAQTFESLEAAGPERYLIPLDEARAMMEPERTVIPSRPGGVVQNVRNGGSEESPG